MESTLTLSTVIRRLGELETGLEETIYYSDRRAERRLEDQPVWSWSATRINSLDTMFGLERGYTRIRVRTGVPNVCHDWRVQMKVLILRICHLP